MLEKQREKTKGENKNKGDADDNSRKQFIAFTTAVLLNNGDLGGGYFTVHCAGLVLLLVELDYANI